MKGLLPVFRRELSGYFTTPVALVFIVIFLFLAGVFTFQLGGFFERGQADLVVFFNFHPWLYLFLIPAVSMRLWAEERKTGTIELLLTLPISLSAAVVGKFLAAWAFTGIALALTFPIWITTNYLGNPDNGVIFAGYLGSLLMAGAFLAIGSCISATTKSQVIAFIVSVVICLLFMLAGLKEVQSFVSGWLPPEALRVVGSFSFLSRFDAISKGVLDLRDMLFFGSIIVVFVAATGVVVNMKKAE
ncbi:MAG: ABC transporter permease subunit [Phycisphaeraceae bacterium]|nr:ABC transporter permease subunit [Phycisphaeraceae bacterium]